MSLPSIHGTPVSPGLAVGPVHVVHAGPADVPTWTIAREDVPLEIGRLAAALNQAGEQLSSRQDLVARTSQKDAEIFVVHRMILQDPGALKEVEDTITEQRINAESAVKMLIDRFEKTLTGLDGDSVRAYAADVSDPWRFVLEVLLDRGRQEVVESDAAVVVAAAQLTPKAVTFLARDQILAVITEAGGRFSHGAVLARSFGIPCIIGLPNLLARLEQGMTVAVDADQGIVQLRPDPAQVDELLTRKKRKEERIVVLARSSRRPARTPDGVTLAVKVNIESIRDLDTFDLATIDGVGLLRTEFLYMERNQFPSVEEQYRMYRRVLEQLEPRPTTVRLLDIGGDKPLPYFKTPQEPNPALGWRGIRITLQWNDLLRSQLQAFLRASPHGEMHILMPMVTNIEEVRRVHEIFDDVRRGLVEQGYEVAERVPVGVMIEVPSMLLVLDQILDEVDFLSVGTNDLVQYLLAVDRDNPWVSTLYDPHHPAVFRALHQVATTCRKFGKPVSMCGDMAGDPAVAILLLGMGFSSVSVAPQFIPEIKYAVRRTTAAEAKAHVEEVLARRTSTEIRAILDRIRVQALGLEPTVSAE
ncbi:MAG: phosphoenolpyruvate--protein phosphotransferase [Planctomycetota bacterium]